MSAGENKVTTLEEKTPEEEVSQDADIRHRPVAGLTKPNNRLQATQRDE